MPAQVSAEDFPRLVAAFKRVLAEEDFAEVLSLAKETSHALFCGDKGNFATLEERIDAFMLRNARTLFHAFCLMPRYGLRVFHSDDQGSLHGQLLRSTVSQPQVNVLAVEWDTARAGFFWRTTGCLDRTRCRAICFSGRGGRVTGGMLVAVASRVLRGRRHEETVRGRPRRFQIVTTVAPSTERIKKDGARGRSLLFPQKQSNSHHKKINQHYHQNRILFPSILFHSP